MKKCCICGKRFRSKGKIVAYTGKALSDALCEECFNWGGQYHEVTR